MAYENIKFHKSNMATRDGYFYLIDYPQGLLSRKTADGNNTFQYPLDIPNSFTAYTVNDVICLQYDGYSLWSLQDFTDGSGQLIRKWVIDNFICVLDNQYPKITNASTTYNIDTFSVEYYNTNVTNDITHGTSIINIDEFADSVVYPGTVIGIGYNKYNERETVTVSGIIGQDIYTNTPVSTDYFAGDPVVITPSVLLLNNYIGQDNSKGSLVLMDPYTGFDISTEGDVEYLGITASKFIRLQDTLQAYPDVHTLAYVKGTNLKLKNMSDLYRYRADIRCSDTFDGIDNDPPDETRWTVPLGNPTLQNNKLFCATVGVGHDKVESTYVLVGDFNVQVSGTMGDFVTFSGIELNRAHHYMGLTDLVTGAKNTFGLTYMDNLDDYIFVDNFSDGGINWTHGAGTTNYDNGYMNQTTDGTVEYTDFFDWREGSAAVFDFMHTSYGSGNDQLHISPLYGDGNNRITIYLRTYSSIDYYLRLFVYVAGSGVTLLTSQKYHFYNEVGTWYTARVEYDDAGLLQFKFWYRGTEEPETWDYSGIRTGLPLIGRFYSYSQLTGYAGAGIDNITIHQLGVTFEDYNDELTFASFEEGKPVDGHLITTSGIGWDNKYKSYSLRMHREGSLTHCYYRTLTSGIVDSDWVSLSDWTIGTGAGDVRLNLGLESRLVTVSGSYFDDLECTDGFLRYPNLGGTYYGIMQLDNVQTNQSTFHTIYDIDIEGDNLYRLQKTATYYGSNYSWSTYNFQISPIRSFIDFITVDSDTHILPATGRNVTPVRSVTLDQYGQGVVNRPVTFIDDDDVGFITTEIVYTDIFYNTGRANTAYTSGTDLRVVTINAKVTQLD